MAKYLIGPARRGGNRGKRVSYRKANKPSVKKIAQVAQKVVNRNVETKKKQSLLNEITLGMAAGGGYPAGYRLLGDESYRLTQGDGYANMSGHVVNAVGHYSCMYFTNTTNNNLFCKLMWMYSRTGVTPDDTNHYLLENNSADTSQSNNVLELHQRVNKENFLVMRSWDFRLGPNTDSQPIPNTKLIKHYHNHRGRKLIFNGSNTYPINGRFFYVVMFRRTDNDGIPVDGVEFSAAHQLYFKDP